MAKGRDPQAVPRVGDRDEGDRVRPTKDDLVRKDPVEPDRLRTTKDDLSLRDDPAEKLDRLDTGKLRPPAAPAPAPAPDVPAGARVWENRSGEEGSGYTDIQGPDIVYADGTWYAVGEDGSLQPFHEGQYLDFEQVDGPTVEALGFESVAGTALFGMGMPADFGLRLDGETGDFVTEGGAVVDPDTLALVRAADGTTLAYDADADQWSTLSDLGVPLPAGGVPAGPYTVLGGGPGSPPPLDALPPGTTLHYDPASDAYLDAGTGHIVGFHHTRHDEVQSWENRSGEEGSLYDNMQGPDIIYLDEVWYAEQPDGSLVAFHEGRFLDFEQVDSSTVEALQYEVTAGTPLWGSGLPSQFGLRLDGETGGFVDGAGNPVDLETFDPAAPPVPAADEFGSGAADGTLDDPGAFGDGADEVEVDDAEEDPLSVGDGRRPGGVEEEPDPGVRPSTFELDDAEPIAGLESTRPDVSDGAEVERADDPDT